MTLNVIVQSCSYLLGVIKGGLTSLEQQTCRVCKEEYLPSLITFDFRFDLIISFAFFFLAY